MGEGGGGGRVYVIYFLTTAYASECNGTALLRCTIEESSDCCMYFSPDDQCLNGSCPGTSMFNQEASECICSSNYSPRNECMADLDACEDSPCENGATCTSVNGSFVCNCPAGYTGRTCNADVNNGSVCMNGGELSTDGESCNCTEGWSGQYCDVCTLEGCVNCTADESQNYTAVCIQCEDGYLLENQTCISESGWFNNVEAIFSYMPIILVQLFPGILN